MKKRFACSLSLVFAMAIAACLPGPDGDPDAGAADAGPEPLAIIGNYVDDWGMAHVVTQTAWTDPGDPSDSVFHISQYSNDDQYIVASNDPANPYTTAGQWSRFDWTRDATSQLYFCQITYTAATEAAALATTSALRTDLTTGCNGFAWSKLTPQ